MGKKGTLGTVMSLVLMIIVLTVTFIGCSRACQTMEQTKESSNNLISKIKEVNKLEEGSSRNEYINLDDDTMIFGFNSDAKKITFSCVLKSEEEIKREEATPEIQFGVSSKTFTINKPNECINQGPCLCYASDVVENKQYEASTNIELKWEKIECYSGKEIENIEFSSKTGYKNLEELENNGIIIDSNVINKLTSYSGCIPSSTGIKTVNIKKINKGVEISI